MIYGCESWIIRKEMRKSPEATEMWFLRRMLRIPWTARRTNKEVLQMSGTKRELLTVIMKRELGFLGHVLRRDGLESTCLLGMIEGKIARGRHRLTYMDGIEEAADIARIGEVTNLQETGRNRNPSLPTSFLTRHCARVRKAHPQSYRTHNAYLECTRPAQASLNTSSLVRFRAVQGIARGCEVRKESEKRTARTS